MLSATDQEMLRQQVSKKDQKVGGRVDERVFGALRGFVRHWGFRTSSCLSCFILDYVILHQGIPFIFSFAFAQIARRVAHIRLE